MLQAERVEAWLRDGTLVPPRAGGSGFVDLVRALLRLGGCEAVPSDDGSRQLEECIGEAERCLVVLVDGLGDRLLSTLPDRAFLRSHRRRAIHAVFPSTTSAALTTLATARWPAEHAVAGWWTYLPALSLSLVTLPFTERTTDRSLAEFGVRPEEVYSEPSVWPKFSRGVCSIMPAGICNSVYTRYATGGTERRGYRRMAEGVEKAAAAVRAGDGPRFVSLYLPACDEIMLDKGPGSRETGALLRRIDTLLGELAGAVAGRARFVVTADHGQADIPVNLRHVLPLADPLASLLRCQPSGEPRVPYFHVRAGREERFKDKFLERFGNDFALVTPAEAHALGLFGPDPLSAYVRPRLGTYLGISPVAAKFHVEPCSSSVSHAGAHGGLLASEMVVPLVVA